MARGGTALRGRRLHVGRHTANLGGQPVELAFRVLLLEQVLLVSHIGLALGNLLLRQTGGLQGCHIGRAHLLALLGHLGHLGKCGLLALQVGLRELASLRPKGRKKLLLLTCERTGLLGGAQEGLLLGLGQTAKLRADTTQGLGTGNLLLSRLLLGRCERLTTGQDGLLLSGTEAASG